MSQRRLFEDVPGKRLLEYYSSLLPEKPRGMSPEMLCYVVLLLLTLELISPALLMQFVALGCWFSVLSEVNVCLFTGSWLEVLWTALATYITITDLLLLA